jgi:hypothetical protein
MNSLDKVAFEHCEGRLGASRPKLNLKWNTLATKEGTLCKNCTGRASKSDLRTV